MSDTNDAPNEHRSDRALAQPAGPAVVPDALVLAVLAAIREHVGPLPQLFDHTAAAAYVGLSRSCWFRLVSADELPAPVNVPGTGPRWRRADLDGWLKKLKPRRRKSRATEAEQN